MGGGIAGLYCARELEKAEKGYKIAVLEATDRFGGRIETGHLLPPAFPGGEAHKAEFGPMRFELELQPLFAKLLQEFSIRSDPFSGPSSPEPPVEYPLANDERGSDGTPLSALELLKLGVYRMFGQDTFVVDGPERPMVELSSAGRHWLAGLSDANSGFDRLRQEARMPGTSQLLHEHGFWNALYSQLSPMAVAKILHFGTFYHLMPDNPNAAEWAIFWLRLFQLRDNTLSTIASGVQTLSDALVQELEGLDSVTLKLEHQVIAVRPKPDAARVEVEVGSGQTFIADHVVLALPKQPLLELAGEFPDRIRDDLDSVIAFPLLKVFCVTETPPWWKTEPPRAQDGAWNAPTREIHYLPAKPEDAKEWRPPDRTLVLLYTDRPATAYWQPYLARPDFHRKAELNHDEENEDLKTALASVLFSLHWEWAKSVAGIADRTGRDALSSPKGRRFAWALGEYFADLVEKVDPNDPLWPEFARKFPALVGYPARILFRPEEVLEWQRGAIGDYAIRDWSRPPFGAGCHAWAPGAKSWEVRDRLTGFGFKEREDIKNLHVCGEAYSDYQGFIEGALRSALDAARAIVTAEVDG